MQEEIVILGQINDSSKTKLYSGRN